MLNTASETLESLHLKMTKTTSALPGYPVVMAMNGVGSTLVPQLMAEIGDVTCFTHRRVLTAFAGIDSERMILGNESVKIMPAIKKVPPYLRKASFRS